MRKYAITALCLGLACLLLFAACGRRGELELDIETAAQTILDGVDFDNELLRATDDALKSYYTSLNDAVANHAVYLNLGGSAEEVAVLEAVDEGSVARVRQIVEDRLEAQREAYRDYEPGQLVLLADPVLVTRGRYVVLVVCNRPGEAEALVEGLFEEAGA